ncbi:Smad nuclear-interacting protein 1 [Oopsacas minuta]|uniref:Smad nuclear-interacting protein 1 n=1 Tax=Oopsacas minuta TaxID=111878 RepID=A0AAV7KFT9_9METZ|nr:Smad nuclear-interacting protein 1 [Oopsacas minuta]
MTHSSIRSKPRFDEVEHKLYDRISSRLSSARQNRESSKSVEEIRQIRSPVRTEQDKHDVGPRSQTYRGETSRFRGEEGKTHERRDRDRSRSRSPPRRERNNGRSEKSRRSNIYSPSSSRHRYKESFVSTSPKQELERNGSRSDGKRTENWDWSNGDEKKIAKKEETKKPNFALSGKLAEDTNTYKGVVIKYTEPPEARMPKKRWRLYPFKGDESLPTLYIHRQSAYLVGRDRAITDFPVHHPSCSKQHAVLQYRLVDTETTDGVKCKQIILYIIDLNSTNGTYVNNKRIEPQRYIELRATDMLRFGFSSREYILLNEDTNEGEISQESDQEQDVMDSDLEM